MYGFISLTVGILGILKWDAREKTKLSTFFLIVGIVNTFLGTILILDFLTNGIRS